MGERPEGATDLREAALSGVRWFAMGTVITELGTLAASVILAHLIAPAEFGAVAPSIFVLSVGTGLAAASFGTPLISAERLSRPLVQTAFALSLIAGVLVTGLVLIATELFTFGYSSHSLHLIQVVAPSFLLASVGAVSQALLERELDFRRTAINRVVAIVPGTITTLVLAWAGLDGLAIVIGFLVSVAFMSAQAILWVPPPLPRLHREHLHQILSFGLPVSVSSTLYTMQRTIGFAILGARLNATQAGFFWRASQLGLEYQSKVSNVLLGVLFPVLARSEDPAHMRRMRSRMVQAHSAVLFPLMALLIVLAPVLVPWLYGGRWAGAVEATQILAIAGMAIVVNTGIGPLMMAAGHPRALLLKDSIELPLLVAVLIVTSAHGLTAACVGLTAFRLVSLVANQYFLADRLCGIPLHETLGKDILPATISSAFAAGAAWLIHSTVGSEMAAVPDMFVSGVPGLAVYCLVLRAGFKQAWHDFAAVVGRLRPMVAGG